MPCARQVVRILGEEGVLPRRKLLTLSTRAMEQVHKLNSGAGGPSRFDTSSTLSCLLSPGVLQ